MKMTKEELTTILEQIGRRAMQDVKPAPELRVKVDLMEDTYGGRTYHWLHADLDYLWEEGEPGAERAAYRAHEAALQLVGADDRLDCDETGFGSDVVGLTVTIDLD